ncbi:type IV pilus modification PilV family protein [Pajaroellobacter abortibovis]|nr:prepilin-type N-terminal cleavage/methylation domain-containing protein [Pajaroellobacter abortibovis]
MQGKGGFSLLEVMVAISILALVLTVITTAQIGVSGSNRNATNLGVAITLGRCKMTEVEEKLLKFGYPELDQNEKDEKCCKESEQVGFVCDTKIERVELPSLPSSSSNEDGGLSLSSLTGLIEGGTSLPPKRGDGLTSLAEPIKQQFGGAAGIEEILSMMMKMVYPSYKPMFEASIRRVSVTVRWKEGVMQRDFQIAQYVTNPAQGGFFSNPLPIQDSPFTPSTQQSSTSSTFSQ